MQRFDRNEIFEVFYNDRKDFFFLYYSYFCYIHLLEIWIFADIKVRGWWDGWMSESVSLLNRQFHSLIRNSCVGQKEKHCWCSNNMFLWLCERWGNHFWHFFIRIRIEIKIYVEGVGSPIRIILLVEQKPFLKYSKFWQTRALKPILLLMDSVNKSNALVWLQDSVRQSIKHPYV